jgi:hypothetical protein
VVMKNWEPLLWRHGQCYVACGLWWHRTYVFGPALAIERRNGLLCFSWKFSSANFSP